MSSTAQYANSPRVGIANISTANTNRDGTGTIVAAFVAGSSGSRIDKVVIEATSTTTAGMVRLFITKGKAGVTISTITFVGTTATVTTAAAHGLSTGNKITVQGAFPDDYNVTDVAVTVTGATTFTYTMSTTPTLNASTVGAYSSTPSTPVSNLWREITVSAATPSGTVSAFTNTASSTNTADAGYLPLVLPPGWSLRAAPNNAEAFNVLVSGGDF
jgi:hypothetical protein